MILQHTDLLFKTQFSFDNFLKISNLSSRSHTSTFPSVFVIKNTPKNKEKYVQKQCGIIVQT